MTAKKDENTLAIWDALGKTDPAHTKRFQRAGGFKGTAVKPIYTAHKMTEQFGPAGKGWGMGEPKFEIVPGNDGQVAVYCTVGVWWGSRDQFVYGVGGDMVVVKQSSGLRTDDEAFKKAFTDAVGNGMKQLGMSADVHMGLFDDSKYVAEQQSAHADEPAPAKQLVKVSREADKEMRAEVDACATVEELKTLWRSKPFQDEFAKLHKTYQDGIVALMDERAQWLSDNPARVPNGGNVAPDFSQMETAQ